LLKQWAFALLPSALWIFAGAPLPAQVLQDSNSEGLKPSVLQNAPLDAQQRAALQEALRNRDYVRAETLLLEESNRHSSSPQLLTAVASLFFLNGRYQDTTVAMKRAEALAPLDHRSRFTLAMAYIILDCRDRARPELEELAGSVPKNPLYLYWLGRLDLDEQRFAAAVADFRAALELDPAFVRAYDNLGLCYEALGQYDDAIGAYKEAIRLSLQAPSPSPWPNLNLGSLLLKLGRLPEAEAFLRDSLQTDPAFPQAHFQMGLLFERRANDAAALRELEQATALNPSYPEPYYLMGELYRRKGEPDRADWASNTFQKLKREQSDKRPH
jgi:tetratricopeptide (TPR) repeat protein